MLPLMLNMYVARLGEAGGPLQPRIQSEIANHLSYVDRALEGRDYLPVRSPDGSTWRIRVDNAGVITATKEA